MNFFKQKFIKGRNQYRKKVRTVYKIYIYIYLYILHCLKSINKEIYKFTFIYLSLNNNNQNIIKRNCKEVNLRLI